MPQVCQDRKYLSFMYSYPNLIPVDGATVRDIVMKLEPYQFAKLYGAWPKFVVEGDPKIALRRSAERYLRAIGDLKPLGAQHSPVAYVACEWGPLAALRRVFVFAPVGTLLHIR